MTGIEQLTSMRGLIDAEETAMLLGMHQGQALQEGKGGRGSTFPAAWPVALLALSSQARQE
jgi:hypothetical protein